MRIGVVGDTHLPRFGRELPRALRDGLTNARVDLILHVGDFTGTEAVALLEAIAPLDGVAGNNDSDALVTRFGRRRMVEAGAARVGLTHGDLGRGSTTPRRAINTFAADEVDVILFGHSHIPLVQRLADGRWLMNPGSPTDKRRQPRFSWGIVDVSASGDIRPELRYYDDRTP